MAVLLHIGLHGAEDPTKASFPFLAANGAHEAGHQPQIFLVGDAVVVMKDAVANAVQAVGWPPLSELLATTIQNRTAIFV